MSPQTEPQQATTPGLRDLRLPPHHNHELKTEVPVSDKCDALLNVCERATKLQSELLIDSTAPRTNFTSYATVLHRIRSQSEGESLSFSSETPEGVAVDLFTLSSAYLSTQLTHDLFHYWVAVTSALTAATRATMPTLSDQFSDTLSALVVNRALTQRKGSELGDDD